MNKLKKYLGKFLALGLSASMLAGCGSSAEKPSETPQEPSGGQSAEAPAEEGENKKYDWC